MKKSEGKILRFDSRLKGKLRKAKQDKNPQPPLPPASPMAMGVAA